MNDMGIIQIRCKEVFPSVQYEEIEITNQTGEAFRMNQQVVLDHITNLLKCELSQSLVGIYLHGSMAMGALPLNKVILIY